MVLTESPSSSTDLATSNNHQVATGGTSAPTALFDSTGIWETASGTCAGGTTASSNPGASASSPGNGSRVTTNLSACLAVGDCGVSKDRSTEGVQLGAPAPPLGSFSFAFLLFGAKRVNIFSSFGAAIECGLHPFGFPRPLHQWSLNAL